MIGFSSGRPIDFGSGSDSGQSEVFGSAPLAWLEDDLLLFTTALSSTFLLAPEPLPLAGSLFIIREGDWQRLAFVFLGLVDLGAKAALEIILAFTFLKSGLGNLFSSGFVALVREALVGVLVCTARPARSLVILAVDFGWFSSFDEVLICLFLVSEVIMQISLPSESPGDTTGSFMPSVD